MRKKDYIDPTPRIGGRQMRKWEDGVCYKRNWRQVLAESKPEVACSSSAAPVKRTNANPHQAAVTKRLRQNVYAAVQSSRVRARKPGDLGEPEKETEDSSGPPDIDAQGHDSGFSHSPSECTLQLGLQGVAVFVELCKVKRNNPAPAPPTRGRGGGRGYASDGRPKIKRSC
jgi:hypothetical protein